MLIQALKIVGFALTIDDSSAGTDDQRPMERSALRPAFGVPSLVNPGPTGDQGKYVCPCTNWVSADTSLEENQNNIMFMCHIRKAFLVGS